VSADLSEIELFLASNAGILDDFGPFDDVGLDDGGELRGGAGTVSSPS
jgi:hypothetical protein